MALMTGSRLVQSTIPANGATEVPLNAAITVIFGADMADGQAGTRDSISESTLVLLDGSMNKVAGLVTYDIANHAATFTPVDALSTSERYQFAVLGGAGGIEDIIGNTMPTDYVFNFTTSASGLPEIPEPLRPANLELTNSETGAVAFSWTTVEDAASYQLQVSRTSTFQVVHTSLIIPAAAGETMSQNVVLPVGEETDEIFYWRIRSQASDGTQGDWSVVNQFNNAYYPVDEAPPGVPVGEFAPFTVLETFPEARLTCLPITSPREIKVLFSKELDPASLTGATVFVLARPIEGDLSENIST